MSDFQVVFRLVLSCVLSGLIGLERQLHRRAAGLRTHILVCLGSTLIMLTSIYIFDIYKDKAPRLISRGEIFFDNFPSFGGVNSQTALRPTLYVRLFAK